MPNYTDEQVIEAVAQSDSVRQVLDKLGLKPAGGNYKTFYRLVKKLELDTSHFLGRAIHRGKKLDYRTKSIEDYLSNKYRITSHKLRLKLIEEGIFEHKCCNCLLTEWNNLPIPLELDHIDGNNENNNLNNLRLLCPNCHAQTSTYRGRHISPNNRLSSVLPEH